MSALILRISARRHVDICDLAASGLIRQCQADVVLVGNKYLCNTQIVGYIIIDSIISRCVGSCGLIFLICSAGRPQQSRRKFGRDRPRYFGAHFSAPDRGTHYDPCPITGRSRVLAAALCVLPFLAAEVPAQELPRFSCSASVGTGFGLTRPSSVPVVWRVTGHYNVSRRFSVGAGTGVSCYEKTLVPLFADAKFLLMRRRSFTPYAGCAAGYAFAPRRDANGGLLLNPELGVQYALRCGVHLFFAAGYELQRLERLRKYEGRWFSAEFAEQLSHGTLLLKVGVLF